MLLLHTTGSVKIGEIVRSTITYTPSLDPLTPLPISLHLRIKNTASLPLRAAYLHGPYTIYVSVRRQEFDPFHTWRSEFEEEEVPVPQYEPNLKAGASFFAQLNLPQQLRDDVLAQNTSPDRPKSVTWIVEVVSQSIFSTSATVGFEILLGRDEKSIGYGFPFGTGSYSAFPGAKGSAPAPAEAVETTGTRGAGGEQLHSGVLSGSIKLKVQDTADLWNLPPFPSWSEEKSESSFPSDPEKGHPDPDELDEREKAREKGEEARRKKRVTKKVHLVIITHGLHSNTGADMLFMKEAIDQEERMAEAARKQRKAQAREARGLDGSSESKQARENEDADDRELVIVRGFHENVCRTERGIKYLGRRLAKYVLALANPQEPNPHPLQRPQQKQPQQPQPNKVRKQAPPSAAAAKGADAANTKSQEPSKPPYKVTSISFIGHSLGGLVQTYAIAFIHAHNPEFFLQAKPVNFVALASPFLGLSNENPMYVKFALDFGLVGRTGKDLGLTWRAPNMAASALQALATPFSNSKEWHGKAKVDPTKPLLRILPTGPANEVLKMFRNRTVYANVVNDGIVPLRTSCLLYLDWKGLDKVEKARRENAAGQVAGLVGWGWGQLTTSSLSPRMSTLINTQTASPEAIGGGKPMLEGHVGQSSHADVNSFDHHQTVRTPSTVIPSPQPLAENSNNNPFSSLMTLFRPQAGRKAHQDRAPKIYRRFLEAAGDVLNPPLPPTEFLINPSSRPKTIWHDRVYHSEDIPPPPLKTSQPTQAAQLKVEEKIARAYHKDLSWRKVLVKLEPDAHNNIIVRRMFANAHGWPVVQHLVYTHFADTPEAKTADVEEDRMSTTEVTAANVSRDGRVEEKVSATAATATAAAMMVEKKRSMTNSTGGSGQWSDAAFEVTDEEDTDEEAIVVSPGGGPGENTPKGPKGGAGNVGNSTITNMVNLNSGGLGIRWPLSGVGVACDEGVDEGSGSGSGSGSGEEGVAERVNRLSHRG
ncbi:putative serine esterase-domain-containing protein [Peziza echinospora]|nr:putative serine esterase-domain-containing protein [Peziza echinospora]